jgi:F420-dependent oxidoreductase-like protein
MIPLGIAVSARPDGGNAVDDLIDQARHAADAGVASVWLGQMYDLDPLTALAAIGREVPGVALGTSVAVTHSRHPLTMSGQAQTVQAATGGRLVLGIGVSHRRSIEQRYGLDFDRPARHLREYLSALLPLLHDGAVSFHGQTLTADTTGFAAHVAGSTAPPVLAAALGPAMLRIAGELADGTVTFMTGLRTVETRVVPAITAAAAGRPDPQVVVGLPICLSDDPDQTRERAARQLAFYAQIPFYKAVLDEEGVASPADVAIIGDERHLERQLQRLADAGATHVIASSAGGYATAEEQRRTTEFLGSLTRGARIRV